MMEQKMTEHRRRLPRNQAMKVMTLVSLALLVVLLAARFVGILPLASDMTSGGAMAFCAAMTSFVAGSFWWYFTRTDEHDLHANLWSLSLAWIGGALVTIDWSILHFAGAAPRPDAMIILLVSAVVAVAGWGWLRFR